MFIFSSETPVGNRLKNMTGVACILRFALPELDDVEEESIKDSEDDSSDQDPDKEDSDEENGSVAQSFDDQNMDDLLGSDIDQGSIQDDEENAEDDPSQINSK